MGFSKGSTQCALVILWLTIQNTIPNKHKNVANIFQMKYKNNSSNRPNGISSPLGRLLHSQLLKISKNRQENNENFLLKSFRSLTKCLLGINPMGICVPWAYTYLQNFKLEELEELPWSQSM